MLPEAIRASRRQGQAKPASRTNKSIDGRALFITSLADKGVSLRIVQRAVGHKSLSATNHCFSARPAEVSAAVELLRWRSSGPDDLGERTWHQVIAIAEMCPEQAFSRTASNDRSGRKSDAGFGSAGCRFLGNERRCRSARAKPPIPSTSENSGCHFLVLAECRAGQSPRPRCPDYGRVV